MKLVVSPFVALLRSTATKALGVVLTIGGLVGFTVDITPENTVVHYQNITLTNGEIVLFVGNDSSNAIENSHAAIYDRPGKTPLRQLGSIDELGPDSVQYIHFPAGGMTSLPDSFYLCIAFDGDFFLDRVTYVFPLAAGSANRSWYRIAGRTKVDRWFFEKGTCEEAVQAA